MSHQLADVLPRTCGLIEQGQADGLHIGAQVYVSQAGRVVADGATGDSRPGVPLAPDSLVLWLSAGKPVAAVAILQLAERGLLALDDAVAKHLGEFGEGGKQAVTVRHLLTHTAGFRWVDVGGPGTPWDEILARICRAPLERGWVPGRNAGYHPHTSWYVLGELVRRLDGRMFAAYVREEIFGPLGMVDSWIGMSREALAAYGQRIAPLWDMGGGGLSLHPWSTPEGITHCAPGGSGHGPLRELGRLFEMLLGGGQRDAVRLLSSESVRAMTSRQRAGMLDETFRHVIDWGLGVILNAPRAGGSPVPYDYGRHASPETFGHGGSQSSAVLADPAHGLVVALAFNGRPGEPRHQRRARAAIEAVYLDLGLGRG